MTLLEADQSEQEDAGGTTSRVNLSLLKMLLLLHCEAQLWFLMYSCVICIWLAAHTEQLWLYLLYQLAKHSCSGMPRASLPGCCLCSQCVHLLT